MEQLLISPDYIASTTTTTKFDQKCFSALVICVFRFFYKNT